MSGSAIFNQLHAETVSVVRTGHALAGYYIYN